MTGPPKARTPPDIPICAIGASAGGVQALKEFFRHVPDDLGLCYVVIIHLAPDHPSTLSEILGSVTRMTVRQVGDTRPLEPDCVYVIPPDRELHLDDHTVAARPFTDARGAQAPIDVFFRSVAAVRGDGVAVILSGGGSDGARGVKAMKEAGGVIFVQEPSDAEFAMMPRSALAEGVADVVAPIPRLVERLVELVQSKDAVRSLSGERADRLVQRIVGFLRARTGHDFGSYKRATVMRRIARRMQVSGAASVGAYSDYLIDNPEEAQELFRDLLISVTSFFRDPGAYEVLERQAIGHVFENAAEEGIRAWVAGCATGEEAYSLAILLLEEAARRRVQVPIQIFATDLDEGALATAREGRYGARIEADVSPERLRRFFAREGAHYRVRKEVRDIVLFATHSVIREPPFMRLDLIFCRNLLIYMERQLQREVCALFAYGLKPQGYLFLGSAETADGVPDLFAPVDREARLYRATTGAARRVPLSARMPAEHRPLGREPPVQGRREERNRTIGASHVAALERAAPPSMLVDRAGQALHLSPNAARFLLPAAGPVTGDAAEMVRPELRLDLRTALRRALDQGEATLSLPVPVLLEGALRRVVMQVAPVLAPGDEAPAQALVVFLDGGLAPGREAVAGHGAGHGEARRLREELDTAQSRLAASRSEHEASIQELRVANEELQSINEEYRSTAEELETSKEELQSMNEELRTLNAELKIKLETIGAAHSDLENIIAATDIGTLFLDRKMRIRLFTPRVAGLFNVTDADIGRSITDFTHRLDDRDLARDAERVVRDLVPVEREVGTDDGRRLTMRLHPYRTVDDRIEGVVVTFVDVTAQGEAADRLRDSEARLRALTAATTDAIYRMTPDWSAMHELRSDGFLAATTEMSADWLDRYILPEDHAHVRAEIAQAVADRRPFAFEHRVRRADGAPGWAASRAVPLLGADGQIVEWFGSASDITGRKEAEAARQDSETRYRALFDTIEEGFCICERVPGEPVDFRYVAANPAFEAQSGFTDPVGRTMRQLVPGIADAIMERYRLAAETGVTQTFTAHVAEVNRWFEIEAMPTHLPAQLSILFRDITARRHAEMELRASRDRQAFLLRLNDALRREATDQGIGARATRMLAEAMDLDRCYLFRMDPDGDHARTFEVVDRREMPPLPRAARAAEFPTALGRTPGQTLVVRDAAGDPDLAPGDRRILKALGHGAVIAPTLRQDEGDPVCGIVAVARGPRDWSDGEVALVENVAQRIFTAVETARAEAALRDSEDRYRELFDRIDEGFCVMQMIFDGERAVDYRFLQVNPAFRRHTGIADPFAGTMRQIVPGHEEHWFEAFGQIAVTGEARRFQAPAAALGNRWYDLNAFRVGAPGERRVAALFRDITRRREIDEALKLSERRSRALIEGVPQLVWRASDPGNWTWASPQWTAFTGQKDAESHGWGWLDAVHPDDRPAARQAWAAAVGQGEFRADYRIFQAAEDRYRWFQTRASAVRDEAGAIVEWLGTSTDVDDLRALQERQGVLVAELQHRTRNLIAVVNSMSDRTARSSRDLADFRERFQHRLQALGRVQGLLSRLRDIDRVTFDDLIQSELSAMEAPMDRVVLDGPAGVRLRSSTLQTLAMALHELATNAAKYGALGQPSGRLEIRWQLDVQDDPEATRLHIDWRESGVAMPAGPAPHGSGQGRELIEKALPYQLNARTSYRILPDGVHCTISIPVSAGQAARGGGGG